MSTPIYKVYLAQPREAWYALSAEEQKQLSAKINGTLEEVGGKRVIWCDARWVGDQWGFWGVDQYPDIEAVQKHTAMLSELNWFRYVDGTTVLGTEPS